MAKFLIIKIKNIIYSGDNIGDDFSVETTIGDQTQLLKLELKHGQNRILNQMVFQILTDQEILSVPLNVKVTERDMVFDDIGCVMDTLSIRTDSNLINKKQIDIVIDEKVRIINKKIAKISIIFEIISEDAIIEKEKWASIYQYLILRRKDDSNVGIVEVQ